MTLVDRPGRGVEVLGPESPADELKNGGLVCLQQRTLTALPFEELRDDEGNPKVRIVDVDSELYRVAREYMIRLESEDFEDADLLAKMADEVGMTPEAFAARYRASAAL